MDLPFRWPVRVYWEDTDAGGVVYHASYVRFFERARTEYLRALGIEQGRLRAESGLVFVIHEMALKFAKPAKLDDVLDVGVQLTRRRAASLQFTQAIIRAADGALLVDATVGAACVDATSFRPRPIPDHLFTETTTA